MLHIALASAATKAGASERLDQLVGRNSRSESSADMLLKQAMQEVDKKTLMDRMTPEFFNLTEVFRAGRLQYQTQRPSLASRSACRWWARAFTIWLVNLYVLHVGRACCSSRCRGCGFTTSGTCG